jgi:nucleoside 2-deoxyribosyltransferase
MKLRIYLAGPITGMSKADVFTYWDDARKTFTDLGYEVFSPMTGKDYFRTDLPSEKFKPAGENSHSPISCDHAIAHRDMWMVNMVDVVYVNLFKAERVSIGCVTEIAWAKAFGKQIIVSMEDKGVHDHAFIRECATIVFPTPDEAVNYLSLLTK